MTHDERRTTSASARVLNLAQRYLVGGVNSPVRAFRHVGTHPLLLRSSKGARVVDVEGRVYLDFVMGWGALILGHQHPVVLKALREGLKKTILLGLTHPTEALLAQKITESIPSVEQVRFCVSGTEACMIAVRIARAHTKRTRILAIEGCYHGHSDSLMAGKTLGLPDVLEQEIIRVPFNDREAFESIVAREGQALACMIIEPVCANTGVILPVAGYLECIREVTKREGIVLIFDEVVTGFRLSLGGAQERFKIAADLTTLGKIIGGGLPIGAVAGPKYLMQHLAPQGKVYHAGTFAGHPLSMAAGLAILSELESHPPYARLARMAQHLSEGLSQQAKRCRVGVHINQIESLLTVFFTDVSVRNAKEAQAAHQDQFARWANTLRERGVLISPSPYEAFFVSSVHREEDIEHFIEVSYDAFVAAVSSRASPHFRREPC